MHRSAAVIVRDSIVVVNGLPLHFSLPAYGDVLLLDWRGNKGTVVCAGDAPNGREFGADEYAALVAPFVASWEAERLRRSDPLGKARARAHAVVRNARDARLNGGGLIWNGYLVSIDKEATDRMTSQAMQFMAGVCASVRWKMSDGEYVTLDRQGFFAMSAAAGDAVQKCYAVEERKRGIVDALPNAAAVLAWLEIPANVLTGWPDEDGLLRG